MMGKHVEEESLELYAMKRLQAEEADQVEDHLLFCEACRIRLEETERYIAGFRLAARRLAEEKEARRREPAWRRVWDSLRPRRTLMALAAAASLGLVLVVGLQREQPVSYLDVTLRTTRGLESTLAVASGRVHYRLHLDATGLSIAKDSVVTIIDGSGFEVRRESGRQAAGGEVLAVVGKQLRRGTYWVRLASKADPARTLREYRLEVE